MIPDNITKKHVLNAIADIDRNGVPAGRGSKKYNLLHGGRLYPPKYLVSIANRMVNGRELPSSDFSSGKEVNDFLTRLGFLIKGGSIAKRPGARRLRRRVLTKRHDDRCSECKNALIAMLRAIYGSVKIDHKIQVPTRMTDYRSHPRKADLGKVLRALQTHRGHQEFVRLKYLHRCDLYVPSIDAVVEFDESQHFTAARDVALAHYPQDLPLGFDLQEWRKRCRAIDAKDRDPEFRDEQRAWYDCLRDFLPLIKGMSPTIRIYMGDFPWCSLDSEKPADVAAFRKMLSPALPMPLTVGGDGVSVATVIIGSSGDYTVNSRFKLMQKVLLEARTAADAFLFPAGYFATKQKSSTLLAKLTARATALIADTQKKPVVCFGLDGRESKDQIAVALGADGVLALARKFHPTQEEADYIEIASGPLAKEGGHSRIVDIAGKRAFLAVCYDGFGIRHRGLNNPGVDLILDLIHAFNPKGEGGSGEVYFAKHGLAGASRQWNCPAFGAAVFFNRSIPKKWPSGVLWNQAGKSTKCWKYKDNPLKPLPLHGFEVFHACEKAAVRVY